MDALDPSFRRVHYQAVPDALPQAQVAFGFRRVSFPDGRVAQEGYASFPSPGIGGAFLLGLGTAVFAYWLISRAE